MQKLIYVLGTAGVALLVQGGAMKPAAAAIVYPWCAYYAGADSGSAPSCGSSTYEQCMATVSGQAGYCARNPSYPEPAPQSVRRQKHTRG